jgi:hypothetical protein
MRSVIVFLTTPRCGTQWFFKNLREHYKKEITVLHEPIKYEYNLKLNLGNYDSILKPENNQKLEEHFDFVDNETQNKIYVEIGWQSIAGVSKFHEKFKDRLKFVHLYRNPINVAASLVTHNWYAGLDIERSEKAELTPFDPGASLTFYKDRWNHLDYFEKSLYFWTEINLRAIEIKNRYSSIPFFTLKFENIFNTNTESSRISLHELLPFIGLEYKEEMLRSIQIKYDNHKQRTYNKIDWKLINKHNQIIELSNKLGYQHDSNINLKRYKRVGSIGLLKRVIRKIKRHLNRN